VAEKSYPIKKKTPKAILEIIITVTILKADIRTTCSEIIFNREDEIWEN
jgi:hypothetical protein